MVSGLLMTALMRLSPIDASYCPLSKMRISQGLTPMMKAGSFALR